MNQQQPQKRVLLQICLVLFVTLARASRAAFVPLLDSSPSPRLSGEIPMAPSTSTSEQQTIHAEYSDSSSSHSLYLFSLPASSLSEQSSSSSSSSTTTTTPIMNAHAALLVRRLWEFKDDVLGDGRDFFVPRPKTLTALNQLLRQQMTSATECVVLSNCARFDVLLVVSNDVVHDDDENENSVAYQDRDQIGNSLHKSSQEETLRYALAYSLLQQYTHDKEQKKKANHLFSLSSILDGGDQPERLWLDPPLPPRTMDALDHHHDDHRLKLDSLDVKTVANSLQCLEGPATIARYLCRVATGLQAQGRRPDRQVVFRPFSSRDAHIMLQLKRTADIASPTQKQEPIKAHQAMTNKKNDHDGSLKEGSGSQPRLKALLDMALQSGKAARDPDLVPAIAPLKKYGSGGSSSRYSLGEAPTDLTNKAAQQATELAIDPMVAKYVQKWKALEVSEQIQSFRLEVESAVEDLLGVDLDGSEKAKPIRALLHPYMMTLREGGSVDVAEVMDEISNTIQYCGTS